MPDTLVLMPRGPVHFGYNPPSSDRHLSPDPMPVGTFAIDLERAVGIAVAGGLDSIWISDHLMSADRFRLEAWTMLTWVAARFPGVPLGTSVLADGFRHPPLLAKMAATVSALSGNQVILGYGAGWDEPEYRAYGYDFPPTANASTGWTSRCRSSANCGRAVRSTMTDPTFDSRAPTASRRRCRCHWS